jgi:cyclic dehypoxanthinyl futalosine synthase
MATNEPAVQAQVDQILAKVHEGKRITYDEGLYLYQHAELLDLADAANARRQQLVPGDTVTYLIDRNINYTNVCVTDCQFCNFYALPGDKEKGYVNSKLILGNKI